MSKSITLLGATYSGVPAVDLPQTGGGTARFIEPSDTTATASDVAAGKYFYTAAGVLTEGTSTGGGGGFVDVVETLPNGGQHHKISGVDLSQDTVSAPHLETGYTAHDSSGNLVVGTLSPGGGGATLITKSITANGTYNASSDNADGYSSVTVNVSGGGGGGTSEPRKDVNFFDYDGTIVASYTAQEALALNSLPSNPSHSGLTAQGWNYTLAEMKTEVTAQGKCDVGQMYITASGDTEIDVSFPSSARLSPIMTIAVNGTITVDWGDNTTPDTVTGGSLTTRKEVPHTYASAGNYTIVIHVVSGSFQFYAGSTTYALLRKGTTESQNRVYSNTVKAIRIGSGTTSIGNTAFTQCYSLRTITIPSTITSIDVQAFRSCYSLAHVTIPKSVTNYGNYLTAYCYALASVSIPSGVTNIGANAFYQCYALGHITIPSGVTTILDTVFYYCYTLEEITIPSGVTSIGNSSFNNCCALASVSLPSGLTTIGTNVFYYNYSLAEVTIPSTVTSIGKSAFENTTGVKSFHVLPTTPPTLGASAFSSIPSDCVIYVPSASLSDYQTASGWSTYASYMQGE